jgi:hypothetical protein
MVPMRPILEALGATLGWDAEKQAVSAQKSGFELWLPVNEQYAYVNNKILNLDAPAVINNGFTMVPVRFISESLGASVNWDSDNRIVNINY